MSSSLQPTLLVIGGPNGSGKSTITAGLVTPRGIPVVDPDAIARGIRPDAPELAAMAAGREALLRQEHYLAQGTSFAVETTLSGNTALRLMEEARRHGFKVELVFVGIEDVETNIDRVGLRVASGGHHVPEEDIRRRYARSMQNVRPAIERADWVTVFDNTSDLGPQRVLEANGGRITMQAEDLPRWVVNALGDLLPR